MSKKTVKYQGHQGDSGFLRILEGKDGNFYIKVFDRAKKVMKDKLYATAAQMSELWEAAKPRERDANGLLTIVEGEATNHHHCFPKGSKVEARDLPSSGLVRKSLVRVSEAADYNHYHTKKKALTKEHDTIKFPAGLYETRTQIESDLEGQIKRVID